MKVRHSTGDDRHPYTRVQFWNNNPFWETGMYSEKSKEYFRSWLQKMNNEVGRYQVNYYEKK